MDEEILIEIRKEKIVKFLKNPKVWVIGFLIIAVILGIYVRSLPMSNHGGNPGLWDIASNSWTLGPDLDPWLFTRMAKAIVNDGSIPEIDTFRNVPLGFETSGETILLPYMISWTYKIAKIFYPTANVEFGALLFPVIMFGLTIIAFFFFVREIFSGKSKQNKRRAGIISLISTFLMITMPVILPRTIAGIPEKESPMFFFLFLALFLFLKAWNSEKIKNALIFGILAGISTAGMTLVSGLSIYLYSVIFITGFIAFILNKFEKKEMIVYFSWYVSNLLILSIAPGKGSIDLFSFSWLTRLISLFAILLIAHILLWKTKISENKFLKRINLPKNITTIIITISFLFILILIIHPSLISEKVNQIERMLFKPTVGRWNQTVAENKQPYFKEWVGNFGPFIKNIPILFWMFFIGSIVLFKKMLRHIEKKDSWILTGLFVLFLMGLIFSRHSSSAVFNGENFISRAFFLIPIFLLLFAIVKKYMQYEKNGNEGFRRIEFSYILLLSLSVFALFSARSAVRLIMILGPIAPIFAGYLIDQSYFSFKNSKEEKKLFFGAVLIVLIILSLFAFTSNYKQIKSQSYNTIPSVYNQQWQKAMSWVRENTDENAVFSHWWDYGYWVQSIGNRATVLDGGNAVSFWNYYMGRLVLTGDNQNDALEFLYNHDANYLLIDSTDIGKYGAFSSIGSDENYDRLSFIPTMISNPKENVETNEGLRRIYYGGIGLDEDITYELEGNMVRLPSGQAGLGGVLIESSKSEETINFKQPMGVFVFNNAQYDIPIRYMEYEGTFFDFGSGLESAVKIISKVDNSDSGVQMDEMGGIIYISPRVLRGYLAQKYLLNDPFGKFPNFKLSHSENNFVVSELQNRGIKLGEFVYYQGLQGPIKIWSIEYGGNEKEKPEYLDKDSSKYLSWEL